MENEINHKTVEYTFITCGYHSPSLLNVESISPLIMSLIKSNKLFSEGRSHTRGQKIKRVKYQINIQLHLKDTVE